MAVRKFVDEVVTPEAWVSFRIVPRQMKSHQACQAHEESGERVSPQVVDKLACVYLKSSRLPSASP